MGRGEVLDIFSNLRRRAKKEEENPHQEALDLLQISSDEIPSREDLLEYIEETRLMFADEGEELPESLLARLESFREITKDSTPLERLLCYDILLNTRIVHQDIFNQDFNRDLEKTRAALPDGNWENDEVAIIHLLGKYLPLIRLSGQTMEILRQHLEDQLSLDLNSRDLADVFQEIVRQISATRRSAFKDIWPPQGAGALLNNLICAALSREDPQVLKTEKIARDNFAWAQDKSMVANRMVEQMPLVFTKRSLLLLQGRDDIEGCFYPMPGMRGREVTAIAAPAPGKIIDEAQVCENMVHEMIHDTQNTSLLEEDLDADDRVFYYDFLESLTDGLTILRTNPQTTGSIGYFAEVHTLYQLLKEAGVPKEDYEDRIHYLNSLPVQEALAVLSHWRGKTEEETKKAFLQTRDRVKELDDKKREAALADFSPEDKTSWADYLRWRNKDLGSLIRSVLGASGNRVKADL